MFIVLIIVITVALILGIFGLSKSVYDAGAPKRESKRADEFYKSSVDLASSVLTYDDAGWSLPEQLLDKARKVIDEK